MPAPISREYRIYLALWRKAFLSLEPVIVKCPNNNMAIAMRQGMYRAIRPYRNGQANDQELLKAAEKFVVYLVAGENPNDIHFIEFRERKTLSVLEAEWAELGLSEDDLLLGDERSIDASLHKILEETEKPTAPQVTPFYSREE